MDKIHSRRGLRTELASALVSSGILRHMLTEAAVLILQLLLHCLIHEKALKNATCLPTYLLKGLGSLVHPNLTQPKSKPWSSPRDSHGKPELTSGMISIFSYRRLKGRVRTSARL